MSPKASRKRGSLLKKQTKPDDADATKKIEEEKDELKTPASPQGLTSLFLKEDIDDKPAPVDTDEMKVFRRFQDDNAVHTEDLSKCLRALGYPTPHEEWFPLLLK